MRFHNIFYDAPPLRLPSNNFAIVWVQGTLGKFFGCHTYFNKFRPFYLLLLCKVCKMSIILKTAFNDLGLPKAIQFNKCGIALLCTQYVN